MVHLLSSIQTPAIQNGKQTDSSFINFPNTRESIKQKTKSTRLTPTINSISPMSFCDKSSIIEKNENGENLKNS